MLYLIEIPSNAADRYRDFGRILDRKDVDAAIVANPDHRERPAADVEEGRRPTTFAHPANMALATRARLD